MPGSNPAGVTSLPAWWNWHARPALDRTPQGLGVRIPRQAPHARVTELVYVSGSNPGARHGLVSSNLTSRTKYRTGVMGAHLALTREDEDRNLGAVPKQICRMMSAGADTGLENRVQQRCCGDRHLRPAPYGVIP